MSSQKIRILTSDQNRRMGHESDVRVRFDVVRAGPDSAPFVIAVLDDDVSDVVLKFRVPEGTDEAALQQFETLNARFDGIFWIDGGAGGW
jgi:hypothetical protein